MKRKLGKKALLLVTVVFLVTIVISTGAFAEPLKTEKFYFKDPESESFEFYEKNYGVLKLEINNIISTTDDKIVVQSPSDVVVVEEVNGARLKGYKMTKEEVDEYYKISEENQTYYNNPETKLGYSVDNNKIIESTNSITGTSTVS